MEKKRRVLLMDNTHEDHEWASNKVRELIRAALTGIAAEYMLLAGQL
jgi:hypothetical protein